MQPAALLALARTLLPQVPVTLRPELHFTHATVELSHRKRTRRAQSPLGRVQPRAQSTVRHWKTTASVGAGPAAAALLALARTLLPQVPVTLRPQLHFTHA